MVRPRVRLPRVRLAQQLQQRSLHSVPKLDHDFSNGVPGVLSADGFQMAWTEYMTHTLDKLNALTAGMSLPLRMCRATEEGMVPGHVGPPSPSRTS